MSLSKLPKTTARRKKRLGRGYGSGKGGHTVGRGAKGLKARGQVPLTFAGTKIKKSFIQRLPMRRGKGKFKALKPGPIAINVKYLNLLPKGTDVNLNCLIKHKIVDEKEAKRYGVKILGDGALRVSLKVELPCSQGAAEKIEKAGGEIVPVKKSDLTKKKEPEKSVRKGKQRKAETSKRGTSRKLVSSGRRRKSETSKSNKKK